MGVLCIKYFAWVEVGTWGEGLRDSNFIYTYNRLMLSF